VILSDQDRWVFVSTPKCATNSLYQVLQERFGGVRQKPGFHINRVPPKAKEYFRFTVVRNPFSRAVAIWWSTVKNVKNRRVCRAELLAARARPKGMFGRVTGPVCRDDVLAAKGADDLESFLQWLIEGPAESAAKRSLRENQTDWLRPAEPFQKILRLERLEEEVLALPFWKPAPLPHLNRSDGRPPWRTFITPEVRALVVAWAGPDFERYGYATAP